MADLAPVFYDCEASGLEGCPIEIGWAFVTPAGTLFCEAHQIFPAEDWRISEHWDDAAQSLHGISLADLLRHGRPAWEIARRMNRTLGGRELFSDSPHDEAWLRQMFDAAGLEPTFIIRRTDALALIARAARQRRLDADDWNHALELATRTAPRGHRAEADARHLAVLWQIAVGRRVRPSAGRAQIL